MTILDVVEIPCEPRVDAVVVVTDEPEYGVDSDLLPKESKDSVARGI